MKGGKGSSISHIEAREKVLSAVKTVEVEKVPLEQCFGRILAQNVCAADNVPPFDRSPLDGYAFRAADVEGASSENPVTLKVIDYIPAGDVSHCPVTEGTAVRLMTGAPIPEGADAVTMYEVTEFTDTEVKIFRPSKPGDNIVLAGEDVKKGTVLASPGMKIDIGLMGTLASQNIAEPLVYKKVKVGLISTGSELVPVGSELQPGKIFDSNSFTLAGAVESMGMTAVRYGIAADNAEGISEKISAALEECDAVLLTGGASVGDFDVTPEAMVMSGVEILFRGVALKPGMACSFGVKGGKLVCGLSGNPASSLTTFLVVSTVGLKKIAGCAECIPAEFDAELAYDFKKKSKGTRVLRGRLDLSEGKPKLYISQEQGNVVISSTIGCDCLAFVPAGSGPLPAGTMLKAFMID